MHRERRRFVYHHHRVILVNDGDRSVARRVRDGSRLNQLVVVRLPPEKLTQVTDFFGLFQWPSVQYLGFGNNQVFVDGQMMIEARWPNTTLDVTRPRKASADFQRSDSK